MHFPHFGHDLLEVVLLLFIQSHTPQGSLKIFKSHNFFQGIGHIIWATNGIVAST